MPKEMLPIVDKPTIQYIIEEAVEAGIEDIIIVTGKSKRAIEDHFDFSPELERNLEEKGKTELLEKVKKRQISLISTIFAKRNQKDSVMPFGAPETLSGTSRSQCSLETILFKQKNLVFAS